MDDSRELDDYLDDRLWGRRSADEYWRDVNFDVGSNRGTGSRVVLFTNLVWDSAVIGRDRAFSSIVEWITSTIRLFAARPGDELIVRVHPAEIKLPGRESRQSMESSIRKELPSLPANVTIVRATDPTSSYSLMDATDFGLVYSSTTGLEMVLRGKPVVVAAQTHYSGKGFTLDAESPSHYAELVTRLLDDRAAFDVDVDRARRYAYLFFFRAPYVGLGVQEHIRGLVRLTARTVDDLRPGASPDLDRLCQSVLDGRGFMPASDNFERST
jgi:hypothetical protein